MGVDQPGQLPAIQFMADQLNGLFGVADVAAID